MSLLSLPQTLQFVSIHVLSVSLVCSYIGAPVTFEEVLLNYEASDDEYDNAILAMQRNSVALKGLALTHVHAGQTTIVFTSQKV